MDNDKLVNRLEIRQKRRNRLVESLAKLRTEESADVCLISGEKQFFAHKLVLEASSPFFVTAIEESGGETITYDEVDPETLEIVLDYLYLGDANKLSSIAVIRKVMDAALFMDLPELFEYCATILMEILNARNFVEIWDIAVHYHHNEMLKKTHFFLVNNANELMVTEQFVESSIEQMMDVVQFTTERVPCFDRMFIAMVSWIRHDLEEREQYAAQLFATVNPKLLSRQFLKTMLEDEDLMTCSTELYNRMNELGVAVFVLSSPVYSPDEGRIKTLPATVHCKNVKICFFCEYKTEEIYDASTKKVTKRIKPYCVMQQFDLHSMMWQTPQKICFTNYKGSSMFQYGRYIYIVGGALDSVYAKFDVENNTIAYVECPTFNGRVDAGLCAYKNCLYLIGGRTNEVALASCFKVNPGSSPWIEVTTLKYARGNPQVLTSTDYIYIIGGGLQGEKSSRAIEYIHESENETERGIIHIRNVPRNVPVYFAVSGNTLFGFYVYNNDLVRLWYNHNTNKWIAKSFPTGPLVIAGVNAIAPTPGGKSLLFVSTTVKGLRLPTHIWEPDTGEWTKLPPIKGKCELPEMEHIPFVYTAGI